MGLCWFLLDFTLKREGRLWLICNIWIDIKLKLELNPKKTTAWSVKIINKIIIKYFFYLFDNLLKKKKKTLFFIKVIQSSLFKKGSNN